MPNHFHLLLRTGNVPMTIFMRRLLTGYAHIGLSQSAVSRAVRRGEQIAEEMAISIE
jgi:hypothetical protein